MYLPPVGIGWGLSYKQADDPLLFDLALVQCLFEHRRELIMDFGSFLQNCMHGSFDIRFHVSTHRLFYYFSMLMKGNKMQVVMVIKTFIIVQSSVFVLYLQSPPDTVEDTVKSLKDENYPKRRFTYQLFLLTELALATCCVLWGIPKPKNNH